MNDGDAVDSRVGGSDVRDASRVQQCVVVEGV